MPPQEARDAPVPEVRLHRPRAGGSGEEVREDPEVPGRVHEEVPREEEAGGEEADRLLIAAADALDAFHVRADEAPDGDKLRRSLWRTFSNAGEDYMRATGVPWEIAMCRADLARTERKLGLPVSIRHARAGGGT